MSMLAALHRHRPRLAVSRWSSWLLVIVVLGYLLYTPLVSVPFANTQKSLIFSYALVGLGLNLLTGLTGQISLGHGAFFALGAYLCAVLVGNEGWFYLSAVPVAGVVGFALGYLFGRPALRLQGLALALVTLALALVTPSVIKRLDGITQGREGIILDIAEPPSFVSLDQDQWIYYVNLLILVAGFVVCERLSRGHIGRSMIGVRDNENVAMTLGIRPATVKTRVFAFSAAMAAIGGVTYAYAIQFVGPEAFGLDLAIAFITVIVVGGLTSNAGAVLGAVFIVYMPSWTQEINQSAAGIGYGVALVLCMLVLPAGLIGLVRIVGHPLVRRVPFLGPNR
ncbi:branched-chain amino acid ABC transporter permease [Nocardioides sp. LHD-245]|uniref:branched-chain amino acid ABC transporter permease n=1 Tax=Nocardioides sp. LHD-245 TaxID=3051387 RepID=UPI0027E152BB|nr:branched-chain amino acid ABC transporter permease [Nocardioides sp. LHD-245]